MAKLLQKVTFASVTENGCSKKIVVISHPRRLWEELSATVRGAVVTLIVAVEVVSGSPALVETAARGVIGRRRGGGAPGTLGRGETIVRDLLLPPSHAEEF